MTGSSAPSRISRHGRPRWLPKAPSKLPFSKAQPRGLRSFVTQRVDRIEPGRFARRVEAEKDADEGGHAEGECDGGRRHHDRPLQEVLDCERRADAEGHAENAADDG